MPNEMRWRLWRLAVLAALILFIGGCREAELDGTNSDSLALSLETAMTALPETRREAVDAILPLAGMEPQRRGSSVPGGDDLLARPPLSLQPVSVRDIQAWDLLDRRARAAGLLAHAGLRIDGRTVDGMASEAVSVELGRLDLQAARASAEIARIDGMMAAERDAPERWRAMLAGVTVSQVSIIQVRDAIGEDRRLALTIRNGTGRTISAMTLSVTVVRDGRLEVAERLRHTFLTAIESGIEGRFEIPLPKASPLAEVGTAAPTDPSSVILRAVPADLLFADGRGLRDPAVAPATLRGLRTELTDLLAAISRERSRLEALVRQLAD